MKGREHLEQYTVDGVYLYRSAVLDAVKEFLDDYEDGEIHKLYEVLEHVAGSYSVTGAADGSFWGSTWLAECALCHNSYLLADALLHAGYDSLPIDMLERPEEQDCFIRCYLAEQYVREAVEAGDYTWITDDED